MNQNRIKNRAEVIKISDWPNLRDLFKPEWPKHIVPYSLMQNYINWSQKNIAYVEKNVEIYCLNGNWNDGTFYLVDDSYLFFHTLNEDYSQLKSLLLLLDNSRIYRCRCIYSEFLPVLNDVIQALKMYKSYEMSCYLVHLPRQIPLMWENIEPPEDITFKPLKLEHAKIISRVYPLRDQSSPQMFERTIKYNISLGAFDTKTDKLLAWCMQFQSGEMTALQVIDDKYRRTGLAAILTAAVGRKVAELGFDLYGKIDVNNEPPQKFIQKYALGGIEILGMMYHIGQDVLKIKRHHQKTV
uniref:CSON000006 protein n=1 Tax=Culicoides sonorensis TaxID=179676 RepID=A0A336MHH5_CULSO